MKNLFKSVLALVLVFSIASCDDDENPAPAQQTITDIAAGIPEFSILVTALTRTNLAATLDGSGQFTVFAPTNTAFNAFFASLGANVTVENINEATLRNVLLNHVIGAEVKSTAIMTGYVSTLSPVSAMSGAPTISMFIQKEGANVFINGGTATTGVRVTTADVDASNGVIHIVNAVIGSPTVVDHALANPNFSSLVGALTSDGQPDFVAILSTDGPFTVFAPVNAAFAALAPELVTLQVTLTPALLTTVLQYHVVSGRILSSSLTAAPITVTPLAGGTWSVTTTGGAKITDGNGRVANIVATDVQASNGVIHAIDKVIIPSLAD
jgi:uncharacterized surface protein with fasciclin (FAS1) repeats